MEVIEVDAVTCLDLRRRVLRSGTPSTDPRFAEDDRAETFHLGAVEDDGRLLGVITFTPQPTPLRPGAAAIQLRGMATEPSARGKGAGRALFVTGLARLRDDGFTVVWAKARDSALGFYEGMGMHVEGDGYVTEETGLPHHTVVMDIS
jgi:GNAT superfamily N-acetyltransferase